MSVSFSHTDVLQNRALEETSQFVPNIWLAAEADR